MQRVLSTAVLLGLLIATAAAFAVTERLKLVKSPVYGVFVSKTLSPVCSCARGKATVQFKLRHSDTLTLQILDARRRVVATLVSGRLEPAGLVSVRWDGRTDAGTRAPDGVYRPEIHLAHRTILMPNPIELDTRAPSVLSVKLSRTTISPDGDHIADSLRIDYKLSEPAHAAVYLGSERVVYSHFHRQDDAVYWTGRVNGRTLPPGTYTLAVGAVDLAGNQTPVAERVPVQVVVRYIAATPARLRVRKGAAFTVHVDTDAHLYTWTLGRRHGKSGKATLRLTAPAAAGTYGLVLAERGHTTRVRVVVTGGGR